MSADHEHGTYYVPENSKWPIIGSIGMFLFAVGTLNVSSIWGNVASILGVLTLIFMLSGWFRAVITESRAGLYDSQMDRTFRWGMFWFLFSELFFFGTILGALIYVRVILLPWFAGQGAAGSMMTHLLIWPNFQPVWPLLKNPAAYLYPNINPALAAWGMPIVNTLVLLFSAVSMITAIYACKRDNRPIAVVGLLVTLVLGLIFLFLQFHYCHLLVLEKFTISAGVYGSLFYMLIGFHFLHVLVGLIMLSVILIRYAIGHFSKNNSFGFEAVSWYWTFITAVWLVSFVLLYAF